MSNGLISKCYQSQAITRKPKGAKSSFMGKPGWRPGLTLERIKARAK